MKRHLIFGLILAVCIVQVTCYYENQPKLISSDGHLIIESAVDRNITFSMKGNGFLNVGDLNLLKMLQSLSNVSSSPMVPTSGDSTPIEGSAVQLQYLMNAVKGPFGLLKRVAVLENGTADSNDGIRARGRINNINRRLTALERKVTNLMTKLRENNCKTSPCQNGGTCISLFDSFICQCTKNWEGPTCATDVNECSEFAGTDLGCQNGATCKNTPGSYSCLCASGWQGIHCNSPTKDCMANGNELCGHGTCVQIKEDPGYKCICEQGWKTNGVTPACSVDVDECNESKPHCSKDPEVTCINLPGSFVCGGCPPGYSGNGFYCVDIDECQTNNGGCSTTPSVTCINTRGSYKCGSCPLGYIGDGKTCTMRGNRCTPGLCHPLARCKAFSEVVSCQCPPGYQGSGFGPTGCIRATLSPCDLNPCKNGGTCTPVGTNNYNCSCPPGTALPNCARLTSPCAPNPCLNGGTCTPFMDRYVCACSAGYTGVRCQGASRACGGILDSYSGTLRYPVDNGTYNHNARCAWLIKTNYTKILNVAFTRFDLENSVSSSECKFDWLQIHDGKTSAAHNIGRFCGNKLPKDGNLMSTHNFLYLWFRSDNSSAHGGFELHWDSIDPVCGGEIAVKSHGVIASPGSPGNYPPNRDCKWFLKAPAGKRLQFHFFTMKLEAHDSCQYDFVQITDGIQSSDEEQANATSPVLAMFCNTSHPEPLVTPSNEATIYFHSDEDNNDAGFQISYSVIEGVPGCGGVFTTSEGEISSPRRYEDNLYPHNLNCEYLIQLPKGSQITVQFSRFHLESSDSCKFDYLEIFDGRTVDDPTLGKFCGDRPPPTFATTSNNLLIKFRSDWSTSHGGFSLTYKTRCGGIFTEPGVEITSPGYPNNYEALKQCDYVIQAPPGQAILLDFTDFSIEGHSYPACEMDYVAIYDSFDPSNSTLLGRYCSSKIPPRTISSMNVLFVRFVSDISVSDRGFKANFSFVDVACGGVITSEESTIRSPSISERGGYIPDADCRWVIVAPKTHAIQLTWNSFDLEKSTNCAYDFVEIYDNSTSNNSFVGRYCGVTKPPAITSGGNVVTIRFKSDSSQTKDGFSLSFTFVDVQRLCGGNYYTAFGVLKSPGSPEYTSNKICEWVITVPPGQQIQLNVRKFVMEKHSACRFDGLEIRNGGTASSPLIGKYCGTDDFNGLISFSNKLYLKFYSDSSRNYEGFEIEWDGTATGCGGVLTSARGSIISPHYPEPYGNNALCSWRISVSAGSAIHIVFTDLELESHGLCRYDYLEIFDGRDAAGTSMGKYCTSETDPIQLDTTSNHAFMRMKSDDTNQGRGFHLKYQILCQRNITGYSGVIESPNFPDKYPVKADCLWTITVPPGNKIDLEFSHFDVENGMLFDKNNSHVCNFDYVEITEQIGEQPVSNKYCNHMPTKITSKGPSLQIGFRTDGSGENGGFRLEWQINGCGGILTKPGGTFSSPNYPREYPPDTQCLWKISMSPGTAIELMVNSFNMESSSNCRFDGLTISNTEDFSQVVTQLCHTQKEPVKLVSAGHTLYVKFFSDHSYTYKGFEASYRIVPQKCGGPLTVHQGYLYSPNYPKNYPSNQSCEWIISTDPSHTLQFNIEDIGMIKSPNCTNDFLKVYDGPNRNAANLLMTICDSASNVTSVISSGNQMLVAFQSDATLEAKGFRANFSINCGSRINVTDSGMISLENTAKIKSENCTWILTANELTRHVTLQVLHMNIVEVDGNCLANLTVYDGDTIEGPIRYSGCGSKTPPVIVSNGNSLVVHITSEDFNMYNLMGVQLVASYSVLDNACGGELHSFAGQIASPNYPNSYPMNVECVWQLKAAPGNMIRLYVESINIFESDNCNEDYLEVRESSVPGENNTDIDQGTFCGTQLPPPIITENNLMKVVFTSFNAQTMYRGFKLAFSSTDNRCGSEINAASGDITSPGYPADGLRLKRFCEWRITVPEGRRIKVEFTDLDLSTLSASYLQRIGFYHGFDYASRIKFVMGGYDKQPIYSSGNTMMINFWSRIASGNRGFKLHFSSEEPTICVGNLEGDQGIIATPINQTSYTCEYKRTTAVNGTLAMYFRDMSAGTYRSACTMNTRGIFVRRSGSFGHNAFLKKYCGNATATDVIRSPFSDVSILARQGLFLGEVKFKLQYQVHKCGGMFGAEFKNLSSPISLSNVVNPIDCAWYVNYPENSIISILFTTFALNQSCDDEYMMIYNGPNMMSPLLGRFCKDTGFETLTTQGPHLFVEYHSESYNSSGNFQLTLAQMSSGCGGTLHKNSYAFASALNNGKYLPNTECIWTMQADNGYHIGMYFVGRYSLEKSENCSKDHIEVFDRVNNEWVSLGRVCGKDTPKPFNSTGSMMRVIFRTDATVESDGFTVQWEQNCGGVYEVDRVGGIITSPNYPLNYERMKTCNYTFITKEKDSFIRVNFLDFSLENGPQTSICMYDNVTIYKQQEYFEPFQWEKVGTYCKEDSPGRLKYKNRIAVVFQTDRWLESRGFKFEYKLDVCGGSITESTEIESPEMTGATSAYGYNTVTCAWNITIPTGKKVVIRFEELDIEHSDGCYFDGLEVYKGLERTPEKKLATLCGNITAHAPMVSIKQATHGVIYYRSEPFTSGSHRFSAKVLYFDDCDREITLDTKSRQYDLTVIGSDNKKIQDCQYSFKAPEGFGVQLTFNQFHVGSERNVTDCSDNFVEVRDGAGPFGELIGKYCGHSLPQTASTFSSALFARLVTDSSLKGTGFGATVSLVESPCGAGYYNLSSGQLEYLKSPNYGRGNYPPNSKCMWMLEVPAGKTITVEFQDLQLQDYNDQEEKCPDRIEGVRNPNAHHIYCGKNELPATYYSAASKIYVKFQSDEASQDKGFKLAVRQNQICAQNLTRLQGRIGNNYFTRTEHCTLTVQVPENYTIALYFGIFYMHTTDCTAEGIRIYDGLGKDKQMALLCNYITPSPIFTESNALTIDIPASIAEYATTMLDATYLATDKGRGCGGEIFNYGGVFTSPLYPSNNRTRMDCLWTVTVPVNMHIAFKFEVFDMGSKTTCGTDYVKLMKVKGEAISEERRHCGGDTPATFICESNIMQVVYKQTQNFGGTGWQAKFMAIEKGAQVNEY
ncbi:hypothetical protein quinque_003508 [Culex quinquefasciatus]